MKNQLLIGGIGGLILGWILFRKKCPDCGGAANGTTSNTNANIPYPYIIPNYYVPPSPLPPTTLPPTTLPPTTMPPTTAAPIDPKSQMLTAPANFAGDGTFAAPHKRKYLNVKL
jgi:hypothetical protein